MAASERSAGARFEESFEPNRAIYIGELDRCEEAPRGEPGCVNGACIVVHSQALLHIGGQANVVALRIGQALKDVDEASWFHATRSCKMDARLDLKESREDQRSTGR